MEMTIIGAIVGGITRLVPEFFKWLDRKDERAHERVMQTGALEFAKLGGDQRLSEQKQAGDNAHDAGALGALVEAIRGQETPSGVRWVDGFSKLMRPLITFQWVILVYPAAVIAGFVITVQGGTDALVALKASFGDAEKALVASIINFWFLDRILTRGR